MNILIKYTVLKAVLFLITGFHKTNNFTKVIKYINFRANVIFCATRNNTYYSYLKVIKFFNCQRSECPYCNESDNELFNITCIF